MMNVQLIECSKITWPKVDAKERSFSKEFAENLAEAIRTDGLLQPIVVRPNPEQPDQFLGVAGRHRLYAVQMILRREQIEANVRVDMDEIDAEMARLSENYWRSPLSRAQMPRVCQKWWEYYQAKYPDRVGRGLAGSRAAAEKRKQKKREEKQHQAKAETQGKGATQASDEPQSSMREKDIASRGETEAARSAEGPRGTMPFGADGHGDAVEDQSQGDPNPQFDQNFVEALAAVTGMSIDQAARHQRLAMTFTQDQLEVFEQMQIGLVNQLTIAKIKDATKRGEVVNLVASGIGAADAIREVMGDDAPAPVNGSSKSRKATAEEKLTDEEKLTEEEWFDRYCSEKAGLLPEAQLPVYKAEAILYRRISEARHAFRSEVKKALAAAKEAGLGRGWFSRTIEPHHQLLAPERLAAMR